MTEKSESKNVLGNRNSSSVWKSLKYCFWCDDMHSTNYDCGKKLH